MKVTPNLVAWQIESYPRAHADRRNLLIHALTQPIFVLGLITLVAGIVTGHLFALAGLGALVVAVAAQGKGHRLEENPPAPFRSPLDVLARLFVEQCLTFPRFVGSGGFARAWRAAAR
jgi:hypothetical protein